MSIRFSFTWLPLAILLLLASAKIGCRSESNADSNTVSNPPTDTIPTDTQPQQILTGAEQPHLYLPKLKDKRVALLVNQTSRIGNTHLADSLLTLGIQIERIFAPEHGFRGTADAGQHIRDGKDLRTGLPIISLYGKHKKPTPEDLEGLDWLVFDIQDVGARFYTYISSMDYVMEACAENGVAFMVLDRPNPNGHFVDGPVLQPEFRSFVGMHPVPVVHGMTVGEFAWMINGERWLADDQRVELTVIPCQHYTHETPYSLPVKPSPNLPNDRSIQLYPSLCFFEGTVASIGRGTDKQFQIIGHPDYPDKTYSFTPESMPGATRPKLMGTPCYGVDLSQTTNSNAPSVLQLDWLLQFYQQLDKGDAFFSRPEFFDKLAGTDQLRKQIVGNKSLDDIRASWQNDLHIFRKVRKNYLLYPDF